MAIFISLSSRTRFSTTQHCSEKMKYNTTLLGNDEERFSFKLNQSCDGSSKISQGISQLMGYPPGPAPPPPLPLREVLSYQKTHICSLKSFGIKHNLPKKLLTPSPLLNIKKLHFLYRKAFPIADGRQQADSLVSLKYLTSKISFFLAG